MLNLKTPKKMIEFAVSVLLVAALAAFAVLLLKKWHCVEWLQVHGTDLISQMANCDFCLSFWAGVLLSAMAVLLTGNGYLMAIPFFSTPITRRLL